MSTFLSSDELEALIKALKDHRPNIAYLWTLSPGSAAFDSYALQTGWSVARTALGEDAPVERVYELRVDLVKDWEKVSWSPERYGINA